MAKPQNHKTRDCKILSIVWYKVLPARFGGQKAVAHFNEHLASFTPLVCLCSKNNEDDGATYLVESTLPVGKSQFINPLVWWKIYRTAKKNQITHIVLEFPYHGIAAVLCRKLLGVRCILNTHNIEYLRFQELNKWWWKLLFHYERWVMQKSDFIFFKTSSDKEHATKSFKLDQTKTAVVPYGVDVQMQKLTGARSIIQERHAVISEEKILLFAGTLDYQPNAQAVLAIEQKLLPLLQDSDFRFKVLICGRNNLFAFDYLKNINNPSMIFAGEVNDIRNYFAAADVFINPVTTGGGIQTKIIDALSCHLNVVAFESKANGIREAGDKLQTVPDNDWRAFSGVVLKVANEKSETPPAFFKTYNWRSIAAEAYQKICSV